MIEITASLFKTFFVGFGVTHGPNVFTNKEFNIPTNFQMQAFTLSFYLYLDTTNGMAKRAVTHSMKSLENFAKGYAASNPENEKPPIMFGRA